jgi:hypothetical protein
MALTSSAAALPAARLVFTRGAGTESCPSEAQVREAVRDRLGYDPFNSYAASTMLVEVTANGGYRAHLKLVDQDNGVHGDRVLEAKTDCGELMNAMALTISIAIDPESVTRTGPPEGSPPVERPVSNLPSLSNGPEAPPPEDPEPVRKEAKPTEPMKLAVALSPLISVGSAPGVAFGGALGVDAQRGWLVLGVEGRLDAPASRDVSLGRVESWLVAGSLFAGVRVSWFYAAAVGSLGRLAATSEDVAASRDSSALYAGAGARVGVGIPLSERLELRGRLEFLATLVRHRLEISQEKAYEYPVASGNVGIGLAYRFW